MNIRNITAGVTYFGGAVFSFYVVGKERAALLELGVSQTAPVAVGVLGTELKASPAWLVALHSHYDHVGGATRLKREYVDAALACGEETARVISSFENESAGINAMQALNGNLALTQAFPLADEAVEWRAITPERVLRDGDRIDTDAGALEVLATPGHSACSISLFHRDSGALFVSDACPMPLPSGRIWPTAFQSLDEYLESLRKMLALEPEFVCPGHFVFFRGARARRFLEKSIASTENFFENINKLIEKFGPDELLLRGELNKEYGDNVEFIEDDILRYGNREMIRLAVERRGK